MALTIPKPFLSAKVLALNIPRWSGFVIKTSYSFHLIYSVSSGYVVLAIFKAWRRSRTPDAFGRQLVLVLVDSGQPEWSQHGFLRHKRKDENAFDPFQFGVGNQPRDENPPLNFIRMFRGNSPPPPTVI